MANIIKDLTARMVKDRGSNKAFPCKTYATEAAAEKAVAAVAQNAAVHFYRDRLNLDNVRSADYVVFYVEAFERWVGCVNLTEVMGRSTSTGGYIGVCGDFYTW